ncbi:SIMPL domain-containing protein [Lachnospiraceae bacterium 46-61]
MKKWFTTAAIIAMTATITTAGTITAFAAETTQTVNKTIEVNGKGVITAKPDVASIHITVETEESTAEMAQNKNAQKVENVTKALKAIGVRDENIITQHYAIDKNEKYNSEKQTWEPNGYRAYHSFTVKINDVGNVGKYIDEATKAGVTSINSVSFSISDPNVYYKQALQAAVRNAQKSAMALSEALGTTLGSCITVQEVNSYNSYEKEAGYTRSMKAEAAMDTMAQAGGANIRYEDIEITAGVVLTYAY